MAEGPLKKAKIARDTTQSGSNLRSHVTVQELSNMHEYHVHNEEADCVADLDASIQDLYQIPMDQLCGSDTPTLDNAIDKNPGPLENGLLDVNGLDDISAPGEMVVENPGMDAAAVEDICRQIENLSTESKVEVIRRSSLAMNHELPCDLGIDQSR